MAILESLKEKGQALMGTLKFKLGLGGLGALTLVQYASAASLNDSVSPIIGDVAELMTPLLNLILACIPLIISISIIGFIMGILAAIVGKLKI